MVSRWEFLQSWLRHRKSYNGIVDRFFEEVKELEEYVIVSKTKDKEACLIKDEDSALTAIIAMLNFYLIKQDLIGAIREPLVYGMPLEEYQQKYIYNNPQVKLIFASENTHKKYISRSANQSEIGFRLMDETYETMTPSKAAVIAREIKSNFTNPLFEWKKGKYVSSYTDVHLGYRLKIYCRNEDEGERVIRQVLKIQGHNFDSDKFQFIEHRRSYSSATELQTIYGRTVAKPKQRQEITVKFRYAHLFIWGKADPVGLVDTSYKFKEVFERSE